MSSEFQGRGVGTTVLQNVIEEGASHRLPLVLSVVSAYPRAKELYERVAFEVTDIVPSIIRMRHNSRLAQCRSEGITQTHRNTGRPRYWTQAQLGIQDSRFTLFSYRRDFALDIGLARRYGGFSFLCCRRQLPPRRQTRGAARRPLGRNCGICARDHRPGALVATSTST